MWLARSAASSCAQASTPRRGQAPQCTKFGSYKKQNGQRDGRRRRWSEGMKRRMPDESLLDGCGGGQIDDDIILIGRWFERHVTGSPDRPVTRSFCCSKWCRRAGYGGFVGEVSTISVRRLISALMGFRELIECAWQGA